MVGGLDKTYSPQQAASQAEAISTDEESALDYPTIHGPLRSSIPSPKPFSAPQPCSPEQQMQRRVQWLADLRSLSMRATLTGGAELEMGLA